MKMNYNIEMLNASLEFLNSSETDFDVKIKPVSTGNDFFDVYTSNNWYTLRVTNDFIIQLELVLGPMNQANFRGSAQPFFDLFGTAFQSSIISPFRHYFRRGFVTENYGEFFVQYEPFANDESMDSTFKREYRIGNVEVQVSRSSFLFFLLNSSVNYINNNEPDRVLTIKLKGASFTDIEDYLYSTLYYLSQLLPSSHGDLPRIVEMASIEDVEYVSTKPDENAPTESFPEPSNLTSLRFFYHADLLPTSLRFFYHADLLVELEAILYYYKVLEYFFEEAWRHRLKVLVSQANRNLNTFVSLAKSEAKKKNFNQLVSQAQGDINALVESLATNRPPTERDNLRLLLDLLPLNTLWQTISHYQFCQTTVDALTDQIYNIRCKIAHGKNSNSRKISVPSMLPNDDILYNKVNRIIFRLLAKEALTKFGVVAL